MNLTVRTMTRADLDLALDWSAAEGWNPGRHDADAFYAADPDGFFVGELNGEPVGCVAAVAYDDSFGALGLYIVRPEFRGRGLGLAIWNAGMARLGGRTIGLDGVEAQQANYAKSGFHAVHRTVRYEGIGAGSSSAGLEELAAVPFDAVLAYDRAHFPAPRAEFLRHWIRPPRGAALGVVRGEHLAGYGVLRPSRRGFRIGPLFADDERIAEELFGALAARAAGAPVSIDVPGTNGPAVAMVRRHGLGEVFAAARMYTKTAPALPPGRVFAITSMELG